MAEIGLRARMLVKDVMSSPVITVDGNDAIAVAQATEKAIKRAKEGRGPTLIEAVTYIVGAVEKYGWEGRSRAEEEEWKKRDPIDRLRAKLIADKVMSETEADDIKKSVTAEVEEARKRLAGLK